MFNGETYLQKQGHQNKIITMDAHMHMEHMLADLQAQASCTTWSETAAAR